MNAKEGSEDGGESAYNHEAENCCDQHGDHEGHDCIPEDVVCRIDANKEDYIFCRSVALWLTSEFRCRYPDVRDKSNECGRDYGLDPPEDETADPTLVSVLSPRC